MAPEPLDRELTDLLRPAAAAALRDWAQLMGLRFGLDRLLVNGNSGATVAAVYEWGRTGSARKLILKRDIVAPGRAAGAEYARQRAAHEDSPAGFARDHLARLAHEPVNAGDGTWITFQEIVSGGPDPYHVMTSFLAGDPAARVSGLTVEPMACDRKDFVEICLMVVEGMLADWAQTAALQHVSATDFVRLHLADRAEPGSRLHGLWRDWSAPMLHFAREPQALPNPFRLAFERVPEGAICVPALLGRVHGDPHTENILVNTSRTGFVLIDLSRYERKAPLTHDPVHLALSVVNRTMGELNPEQRDDLIAALTGPEQAGLPQWLGALVGGVREAGLRWADRFGLAEEWARVMPLSILANALIFAARPSTTPEARAWFLRLGARAAQAFARVPVAGRAQPVPQKIGGCLDLGDVCFDLGVKRKKARQHGREAELETLITEAKLGHDITQDYATLMADIGYSGGRAVLPGMNGGHPVASERFHCPRTTRCGRIERRGPNGEIPFCFIEYEKLRLRVENDSHA